MEKQTKPDALDRALTDLCRADVPETFHAAWCEAIRREEKQTIMKNRRNKTLWRVALPMAAALVLVLGAVSVGNLIPKVTYAPLAATEAQERYGAQERGDEGIDAALFAMEPNAAPKMAAAPLPMPTASRAAGSTGEAYESSIAGGTGEAYDSSFADTAVGGAAEQAEGAKIVRTADLTIASADYDADLAAVRQLAESLGGYMASVSLNGEASARMDRVAYLNMRVPSDRLDTLLDGLSGIGRVVSRYETSTDMSTQYADTATRLATQRAKMNRLTELMAQATDVSDLLEIESQIADTQYQIDSLESSLRTIDRDVDKSEVTVTLREQSAGDVAQATELTLWQRIGSGFDASLRELSAFAQNLLVFLAMALPVLLPLAALVALGLWLRRVWLRRHGGEDGQGGGDTPHWASPAHMSEPRGTQNPQAGSAPTADKPDGDEHR